MRRFSFTACRICRLPDTTVRPKNTLTSRCGHAASSPPEILENAMPAVFENNLKYYSYFYSPVSLLTAKLTASPIMITVSPVSTRKELKEFIKFKIQLYANNPYAVPPLYADEIEALLEGRNPALDVYDHQVFIARRDGQVVGRVAAIINHVSNRKTGKEFVRFGFIDFIEDFEVAKALLDTVERWGKERGMRAIHGPLGFTDFDPEGMLIHGFDELSTIACIYNHPYYPEFLRRMGFRKDAEWVEYKISIPGEIPDKYRRIAETVRQKYGFRVLRFKKISDIVKQGYGHKLFRLLNVTYSELYGFSELTEEMIDYYIRKYVPLLRIELVTLIADENDELVAFGVALPSLSRAMQKARGRMFPLGAWHLLRALKSKRAEVCDLMLIAAHPSAQNIGAAALLFTEMIPQFQKLGTIYAESNPELIDNQRIRALWSNFEKVLHKRRAVFAKDIG